MTGEHTIIPFREFSDNLTSIFYRILHEHRVFWVEGEEGEFVEVKATTRRRNQRRKSEADLQAFLAAAGTWNDVDVETFVHAVREQRDQSYRSPVDL
jgi:hypothetical protein